MKTVMRLSAIGAMSLVSVLVLTLVADLNPAANAQPSWSEIELGSDGHDVVVDDARSVIYVSLPDLREIAVVDTQTGSIIDRLLLAERPVGMDLSPDGGHLYVALHGAGSVAVIDLTDGSLESISVGSELGSPDTWDVHVIDDERFLVSGSPGSGGSSWIVLVDRAVSSQARIASDRIIRAGPVFTGNVGDDFVYIGEGFSPNSLYKVDLTQPSMPIVAEDEHGVLSGTQRAAVSPDGSLIYLPTQRVRTLDLVPVGTTPVQGSIPAPLGTGDVAFVDVEGKLVRVVDDLNRVAFTRAAGCATTTFMDQVQGVDVATDSSMLYFEGGGSLCAVSLVPPVCSAETVVHTEHDLDFAIRCFNDQTPAGDHTITIGSTISLTQELTAVTLDSPETALTIAGADQTLRVVHLEYCCSGVLRLEGTSNLYIERVRVDGDTGVAVEVAADAGEMWVIDSDLFGSAEVEGGTFVLLRSVIRDGAYYGVRATGGTVSIYRSLITSVNAPIVSSAELLGVGYSIINGGFATDAILVEGNQPNKVEILGSAIFDATNGVVLDGPNTTALIVNSTLWANGTGVLGKSGQVTITNSMIAAGGRGIFGRASDVVVTSSILTNASDCSEPFRGTNNFSEAANCGAGFTRLTSQDFSRFGTLDDHGCAPEVETPWGCTAVVSLLDGHSAIGSGKCDDVHVRYDATGRLEIDQRGLPRVSGACDAGPFETSFALRCNGLDVTINMNAGDSGIGTAGNDVILGTPGDDVIRGLGGDDTICGLSGRDRIRGGPGADTIFGGLDIDYLFGDDGDDTLDGEGGSDRMFGGTGNDLMLGDSGADRMFGGDGDDELRGMGGQDAMWGEAGNDLMQGNFQSDNLFGGPGDDTMFGAGGKDTLFGDHGNDSLNGGNNTDFLDGGADVDSANGGRGRDTPFIQPQVRAGNGRLFGGSGCSAETTLNCQTPP